MTFPEAQHADELARLADRAATNQWSHEIVHEITGNDTSEEASLLASAFYDPISTAGGAAQRETRFLPTESGLQEVEPADVEDAAWAVWDAVASRATHPRVRSALHDLLFWGRCGDVGNHAREAAQAYVELIPQAESIAKVDAARRAFTLIRLAGLDELRDDAVEEALQAVEDVLTESETPKPGVSLGTLEVLADHQVEDERIDNLLQRCRDAYPSAWNTTSTIGLQRKRAVNEDERRDLDRQEVQAWIDEAAASEPLAALVHYERAANLAADRGLTDLRDEAVRQLQQISPADLPLQRITSSVEIPGEQIEQHIEELVGDDSSWWNVMVRIISQGPPSGRIEQNQAQAARHAEEFPLQNLLPSVRLGVDGLPRYQAETDAEREDEALARVEVMSTQLLTQFAAEALERASDRYGSATESLIAGELATNTPVDDGTAAAIGRVVARFEQRDYEAACFTALPLVERLTRNLLLAIDAPVYRTQRQRTPGQYPGLGTLLHELSSRGLDPSWHRYLHTLLTSPVGLNFRNEALHGFVDQVDRETTVAVLIALFYLTFLEIAPAD